LSPPTLLHTALTSTPSIPPLLPPSSPSLPPSSLPSFDPSTTPPFSPPLLTYSVRLLFHELEDNIDLARALDTFRSFNPSLGSSPRRASHESQSSKDSSKEEKLRERRSSDEGGGGKGKEDGGGKGKEEGGGGREGGGVSYFTRYCAILGQVVKTFLEMCYNSFVESEFPPELRMFFFFVQSSVKIISEFLFCGFPNFFGVGEGFPRNVV
jgi:hypothetical protein